MKPTLSVTDAKIVKGKLAGKTSKQIAKEVYPDADNGDVSVRKRLQKATIRDAVNAELLKQGITLAQVIAPITKALKATSKVQIGYEVIGEGKNAKSVPVYVEEDNIPLQLQGSDRAAKLMGLDRMHDAETDTPPLDEEDLKALAGESDEVELTRILFKKNKI